MTKKPSLIGTTVGDGAFRIESHLGSGGMGDVYIGVDADGERAAIKFLSEALVDSEEVRARFRREARIAAEIDSPYVAQIVMAGVNHDRPWIAFELLEGESLQARLRRERALPFATTAWIIDHVLEGLHAAHSAGVIHRDIKPGNIFLERDRACILDFGVSKVLTRAVHGGSSSGLTALDTTLGTPAYMSPEQLASARDVDARTDIYAVGVVAFQALTGKFPFAGRTKMEVLAFKQHREALPLSAVASREWPAELEEFLATCLARVAAKRYPTAEAALAAWQVAVEASAHLSEDEPVAEDADGATDVSPPSSRREE